MPNFVLNTCYEPQLLNFQGCVEKGTQDEDVGIWRLDNNCFMVEGCMLSMKEHSSVSFFMISLERFYVNRQSSSNKNSFLFISKSTSKNKLVTVLPFSSCKLA